MADIANLTVKYQSEGYDKVSKEVDSLTAAGSRVEGSFNKIGASSRSAASATGTMSSASSVAATRFRTMAASASETATQVGSLHRAVNGLTGVFKHAIGGLIAFAALGAMVEFVRSIGDANVNMQKMLNTLQSATGSAEAAKSEFNFLSDTANKLGTDLQGSADGYSRLAVSALAAGVSTSQLHTAFTGLSEGFVATGRSGDEMNRFLVQLEQGLSQGTIQMRDLRAMSQSFPAAFELAGEAAKRMGGSLQSFLKNGGLPAEQFFITFSQVVHEKFATAAEAASNTLIGQLNRLHNTLFEMKTDGDVLSPLTDAVRRLNDALSDKDTQNGMRDAIKGIVEVMEGAANVVGVLLEHINLLIAALKVYATIMATRVVVGIAAAIAKRLAIVGVISTQTLVTMGLASAENIQAIAAERAAAAMVGSTIAARGLAGALALVGGVPGLIAIAVAGIGYAIYRSVTEVDRMKEAFDKVESTMKGAQATAEATAKALRDAANAFGSADPNVKSIGTSAARGVVNDAQASREDTAKRIAEMTAQLAKYQHQLDVAIASQHQFDRAGNEVFRRNDTIPELTREIAALTPQLDALKQQYDSIGRSTDELAAKTMNALVPALESAYAVGSQSGGIVGGLMAAVQSAIDFVNNNPIDAFVNAKNKALSLTEGLVEKAANLGKKQSQIIKEEMDIVASRAKAANIDATKLMATLQAGYQAQLKIEAAKHNGGAGRAHVDALAALNNEYSRLVAKYSDLTNATHGAAAEQAKLDKLGVEAVAHGAKEADVTALKAKALDEYNKTVAENNRLANIQLANTIKQFQANLNLQQSIKDKQLDLSAKQPIMGSQDYQRAQELQQIQLEQQQKLAELAAQRDAAVSQNPHDLDAVARANTLFNAQSDAVNKFYDHWLEKQQQTYAQLDKNNGDLLGGMKAGFADFAASARDLAGSMRQATTQFITGFADQLSSLVTTGKGDFKSLLLSFAQMVNQMITRWLIMKAITGIAGAFGSGGQGVSSLASNWSGPQAKGGAFYSSNLAAYANGIYDTPHYFGAGSRAYATGGVFGEAGPEAIMPLKRGPDGNLGVRAHGGGGEKSDVNVTYNIDARGAGPDEIAKLAQMQKDTVRQTQASVVHYQRYGYFPATA